MTEDPIFVAGCGFVLGLVVSVPMRRLASWIDRKFLRHPCDWECPECGHEEDE